MDLRKEKSSPAVQESFFAFGFVVLFGAGAPPGRPPSVTLDPFLSLPLPVVSTWAKRVWRRGHPAQRDAGPVPFFAFAGCVDPGKEKAPLVQRGDSMAGPCRGDCEAKQFQPAFIQLPSAAAQYGCPPSVTLDSYLSLPWPVVLTRAKRVWLRGHPAQRDAGPVPFFALAGCVDPGKESLAAWRRCHIRGDCEAKQFQPAFIQLPSAAAQYGGGGSPPGAWDRQHGTYLWKRGKKGRL